jgi:hypothetical protein
MESTWSVNFHLLLFVLFLIFLPHIPIPVLYGGGEGEPWFHTKLSWKKVDWQRMKTMCYGVYLLRPKKE